MGIYYNISNQTKRKRLSPSMVGGGSIKQGMVFNCGTLLAWLMMTDWSGDSVTINPDTTDFYHEVEEQYEDVTEWAVTEFNATWRHLGLPEAKVLYRGKEDS